ncbi:hypothetical protein A1354_09080 [Pseudomonas asplenii]|nr:hypothetical protein [Pseudomonas asplenii]PNG41421.1 hypothetical protein A1354_09080 [Pseudomonas asplenii]
MFMTLISAAEEFKIEGHGGSSAKTYSKDQCQLLQQQAIERILGVIVRQAESQGTVPLAQAQFEEACMSMNRFGTKAASAAEQTYCENRLGMDNFMSEAVLRLASVDNDRMRSRYKKHVEILGGRLDGYCKRTRYYGKTFLPSGQATYVDPKH